MKAKWQEWRFKYIIVPFCNFLIFLGLPWDGVWDKYLPSNHKCEVKEESGD